MCISVRNSNSLIRIMISTIFISTGEMYWFFSDWVPPPPMPKCNGSLISSFSYILHTKQFADMAHAVGNTNDWTQYSQLAQTMGMNINDRQSSHTRFICESGTYLDYCYPSSLI